MENAKVIKRYPRVLVTTACIPWNARYEFDEAIFRKEVRHLVAQGIRNIYLFGTAGEGYALTTGQYSKIVEVFTEEMKGPGLCPMVCLISTAFNEMFERMRIAYDFGVREFQLALPSWGTLNDRELMTFFHAVCDPFGDCTFMHYNIGRNGRLLGIKEYTRLAEEIPNLAAAKISSKDTAFIFDLVASPCPVQFFLMDLAYSYGSFLGECSYLVAIPAIKAAIARQYLQAGIEHDATTLFRIDREVGAIRQKLMELVGTRAMDGAYDKLCVKIVMPEFPLRLQPPYESVSDQVFETYRLYLQTYFPHWLSNA